MSYTKTMKPCYLLVSFTFLGGGCGDKEDVTGQTETSTTGDVTSTLTTDTGQTDGVDSTGTHPMDLPDSESMVCTEHEHCTDADKPFCNAGYCDAGCNGAGDDACASIDSEFPACFNNACVECVTDVDCDPVRPICDETMHACVGCTLHADCPDSACNLIDGNCLPDDRDAVVYVSEDACPVAGADGSLDLPFCTVAEGLDAARDAIVSQTEQEVMFLGSTVIIHEISGNSSYEEALSPVNIGPLALLGATGEAPILRGTSRQAGLTIDGDVEVFIQGLEVANGSAEGIVVTNDAEVYIQGSLVRSNMSGGIRVEENARLVLEQSQLVNNDSSGLSVSTGGTVNMTNSTSGGVDTVSLAVTITGMNSSARIIYSTLVTGFGSAALECDTTVRGVDVRNSIVLAYTNGPGTGFNCPSSEPEASITEADVGVFEGNEAMSWFESGAATSLKLTAAGAMEFRGFAQWLADDPETEGVVDPDPLTDIDGECRFGLNAAGFCATPTAPMDFDNDVVGADFR